MNVSLRRFALHQKCVLGFAAKQIHASFLCSMTAIFACLTLATTAHAQNRDWTPLSGDALKVFTAPWLRADLNRSTTSRGGSLKKVPPIETVDFEECEKPLLHRDGLVTGLMSLKEAEHQSFKAAIPGSERAKGDFQVLEHEGRLVALWEKRFFGDTPTTRIYRSVVGRQFPNGTIHIVAEGTEILRKEENFRITASKERFRDVMALRRAREINGQDYFQLFSPVSTDGKITPNTKLYYSCIEAQTVGARQSPLRQMAGYPTQERLHSPKN